MADRQSRDHPLKSSLAALNMAAIFLLLLAAALIGFGAGCDDSSGGDSTSSAAASSQAATTSSTSPTARVIFHAASGENVQLKVEIARTGEEKATGLMNRKQLDADSGMIFVWDNPVRSGFWMKDTFIPLSIAFISEDGIIVDIQEMKAQDLSAHVPSKPYIYAVEANKGWFAERGIKIGDRAEFVEN